MALEPVVYLKDLVEANPSGALDSVSEGDDHIRNAKKALANTFPGMAGRIWRKISRSASGPITKDENMTLQSAAPGITLTANNASVLGNGWMVYVLAPAAGSVNLAAAERINGSTDPYVVPAGHIAMLMSDGAEFYAVIMYQSTPATPPVFPAGTRMVFHQTTPPVGWTKLTNSQYNDAAIRMTTGTVGIGGVDTFTTHFGPSKATAGHTLTLAQSPPHAHNWRAATYNISINDIPGVVSRGDFGFAGGYIDSAGGGGSHTHGLNSFDIKFVDVIVAEKT